VNTPEGRRYCPVVFTRNGKVKAGYVVLNGEERHCPEGSYYISWYADGKLVREVVGTDATVAATRLQQKKAELNAVNSGIAVLPDQTNGSGKSGRVLKTAIADYLGEIKLTKKAKTLAAYTTALDYFTESCQKVHVEDIERKDLLEYAAFLRDDKDQSPRSCWNKFSNVMTFLKWGGIRGLMKRNDWPKYTEEEPEIYEDSELDTLFAACDDEERLWFEFFLMTGMREQEVMYTYWKDINSNHATVRVSHKPDRGWTPKAYKEREIPVPTTLITRLKEWKKQADKSCNLVFPTSGCNPKLDFLDCLKTVAKRADLNEDDFWLHKFRATFATKCLWAGVDLRTVQSYLGHSDIESTMRYLKPSRSKESRAKMNEIFSRNGGAQ